MLSSKVPLDSTAASLEFLLSLSLYLFSPRHNPRRRSLFMRVLSHSDTYTTSIGIWHVAGVAKGVTGPAAHRGVWHGAGVTKSWLHSPTWSKSFAMIEKSLNWTKLSIWMMRETLRDDHQIRIRDNKLIPMSERVCCGYPWMLVHWICLCFSLFLCTRTLSLIVITSSFKSDGFPHKMIIYLKNCWVEQTNHSFLANWPDWGLSSPHSLKLKADLTFYLCIPRLHSFTTPFGRPSASLNFLHSLTPPHKTCRISLLMRVLSHLDTHYLNRHTAGCGCHEILIQCTF